LRDLYGIEVSPDLISAVTDAVLEEVSPWQARQIALLRYSLAEGTKSPQLKTAGQLTYYLGRGSCR
jgi:transposase-like protein